MQNYCDDKPFIIVGNHKDEDDPIFVYVYEGPWLADIYKTTYF